MEARLKDHDILLTPHRSGPLPPDGLKPYEHDLLMAGVHNLGFIGLRYSANTSHFLHWWEAKLFDGAFSDFSNHLFTDQKWIDLVPGLFSNVYIERSETYNVGYWNLLTRRIVYEDGRWTVHGEPILVFHFSGLDPLDPPAFSKHQNRYTLDDLGQIKALVHLYCESLVANRQKECKSWRYTYDYFANGRPVTIRWKFWNEESLAEFWGVEIGYGGVPVRK